MKLSPVLAKYLSVNKELNLSGLGTFHANNTPDPDVDYSKKGTPALNITFEQKKITGFDESLIDFVAKETGKMKVLSESDLTSQINGVLDFINTGKPYFLSGIGTLTKKADGSLEFHKEKYQHIEKAKHTAPTEKNSIPQTYIDNTRKQRKTRPAIIITTLVALAIAASTWFYIKNSEKKDQTLEDVTASTAQTDNKSVGDTVTPSKPEPANTSVNSNTPAKIDNTGYYKYVLEIAKQPRASKRYNQLKKINWPVEIESPDSLNYTLFIKMPAAGSDTTKIKDSLSALSGRRVSIAR